jgi:hypothetical protein
MRRVNRRGTGCVLLRLQHLPHLGFGRIVASGIKAPNMLANLVWSG